MDDTKTNTGPPAIEKRDGRLDSIPRARCAIRAGAGGSGGRAKGALIGRAIGGAGGSIAAARAAENRTGTRGLSRLRRRSLSLQTGARGRNVQRDFALALRLPLFTRSHRGMVMAAALGLSGATSARADLSFKPMSQPQNTGSSWFQRFYLDSTMSYDQLGMVITPMVEGGGVWGGVGAAAGLETGPGTFATHGPGPGAGSGASDVSAAGGRLDSMRAQRSVSFALAVRTPQDFHLTLFTYDDAMSPHSIRTMSAVWGGSRWTFDSPPVITWEQYEEMIRPEELPPAAPAPSASLLGMMGLALVAKWRRRGGRHSSRRAGDAA